MTRHAPWILGLGLLASCGWNNLPDQSTLNLDAPLWDPDGVVATRDGLYVPMPHTGHLLFVTTDGEVQRVGIRPGALQRLSAAPDGETVIAFVHQYTCMEEDEKEAKKVVYPEDCDYEKLEVSTELALLDNGVVNGTLEVPGHFNAVEFAGDASYAIAYLDFSLGLEFEGVANLTDVLVVDLVDGTSQPVPVGFAADRILFTEDGGRAVVLSQNEVAVIDLTADPPRTTVTFPLTLDPDQVVEPVGVELTPDGQYALISVKGAGDLYVLDLENHSVNLVSLVSDPAAMVVDADTDQTILTYGSSSSVDVLEHEYFETESIDLDEPMNQVIDADGFALLYSSASWHDAYKLDLDTLEVTEYVLQNPVISMHLAPTGDFAIALTRAESGYGDGVEGYYDSHPGMEILDLRPGEDESFPYLLEGAGVGLTFDASSETALNALVLQEGVDYLYQLDLYTRQAEEIELSAPPVSIGTVPEGPFYITHDAGLGLITFLDPNTGELTEVAGFAANGIGFEVEVVSTDSDEEVN